MVLRCATVVLAAALLSTAAGDDAPPESLLRENVHKATAIMRGKIESSDAPRPGVTVAHFRVSFSYRGSFKPGEEVDYASFKENDRYPDRLLHTEMVVFLRHRRASYAPPKWETATDLSEFLFNPELDAMLSSALGRAHQ